MHDKIVNGTEATKRVKSNKPVFEQKMPIMELIERVMKPKKDTQATRARLSANNSPLKTAHLR